MSSLLCRRTRSSHLCLRHPDGSTLLFLDEVLDLPVPGVGVCERDGGREQVRPLFLQLHALLVDLLAGLVLRPAGQRGRSLLSVGTSALILAGTIHSRSDM